MRALLCRVAESLAKERGWVFFFIVPIVVSSIVEHFVGVRNVDRFMISVVKLSIGVAVVAPFGILALWVWKYSGIWKRDGH